MNYLLTGKFRSSQCEYSSNNFQEILCLFHSKSGERKTKTKLPPKNKKNEIKMQVFTVVCKLFGLAGYPVAHKTLIIFVGRRRGV